MSSIYELPSGPINNHMADTRTHLGIASAFEQMCDPNETNVVIPHDSPSLVFPGDFEDILKY